MDNENKNLLIISNGYPNQSGDIPNCTFVKSQVDELSKYFKKIIVVVPIPGLFRLINYFLKNKNDNFKNYSYENIEVYYYNYFYIPKGLFFGLKREDFAKRGIVRFLKKKSIKFDLIHAHFISISGMLGVAVKKVFHKPLFITAHGFDIYILPYKNKKIRKKIKEALDEADKIITVSKSNFKCLKDLGVGHKSVIIPNGFDSKVFYPVQKEVARKKINLPINKKIVLTVGNLVPIKNQATLIKAMVKLYKKDKNVMCYIVGKGYLKKDLEKLIKEMKSENYIKLVGSRPHNEIPLWINSADVFVLPSLNEGNPTVLVECLGCGGVYVGSEVGGVKEVIKGNFGFTYKNVSDIDELVLIIKKALSEPIDRQFLLEYSKNFNWKNIVNDICEEYKSFIN